MSCMRTRSSTSSTAVGDTRSQLPAREVGGRTAREDDGRSVRMVGGRGRRRRGRQVIELVVGVLRSEEHKRAREEGRQEVVVAVASSRAACTTRSPLEVRGDGGSRGSAEVNRGVEGAVTSRRGNGVGAEKAESRDPMTPRRLRASGRRSRKAR